MTDTVADSPVVIYVAGSGRNGSTFLGLQLERSPQFFFAGELTHVWQRGCLDNELCGCGQPFHDCEFWTTVIDKAFGRFTAADAKQAVQLRNRVSNFRRLPSLLWRRTTVGLATAQDYGRLYVPLVRGISEVSGCSYVVDSSKYPTDLSGLLQLSELDLRVLHLVRNCNAVVHSWKRQKPRTEIHWKHQLMPRYGAIQTALGWKVFNRAIARLTSECGDRYRRVRYEDLTTEFDCSMASLLAWLGLPDTDVSGRFQRASHSVGGNPCRFQFNSQEVRQDDEWRQSMTKLDRLTVRMLCGTDQQQMGYER